MIKGKTKPITTHNSIYELSEISLGGYKQAVLIRGNDLNNPLLLFVHGGPGTTNIGIYSSTQKDLEQFFTVVNWDQLGAGISYKKGLPREAVTTDALLAYMKELIEYLLKRFGKAKLYLAGHSWGSVLGLKFAQAYPQYLEKYIGISQFVNGKLNEEKAYEYCLQTAERIGHKKAIRELTRLGEPPYQDWLGGLQVRSKWANKFNAAMKNGSMQGIYIKNMLKNTEYKLGDIISFMKGFTFSLCNLWPEVIKIDFFQEIPTLEIPVCFLLGKHDYYAPYIIAKEYADKLMAENKEVVWFENSAHFCFLEENGKFFTVMQHIFNCI